VARQNAITAAATQVKGFFSLMLLVTMHICVEGLAIKVFPSMLQLLRAANAPGMENVIEKYNHSRYFWGALFALSELLLRNQLASINASPYFSISIDTTCDTAKEEHLLLYCTWLDMSTLKAVTQYLCCVKLSSTTAESIASTVLGVLKCLGLDVKRMVGFCTDGASNMIGVHGGVVQKLKPSCKLLVALHCAAHKTGLIISDLASSSPAFLRVDKILKAVHSIFAHSAKRVTMWMQFGSVAMGRVPRKFQVFNATRWFSRAACVTILVNQYLPLILFLTKFKLGTEVRESLQDVEMLMLLHALFDVVNPLNLLSLYCQKENLLPHLLESQVLNCLSTLKSKLEQQVFMMPVVRQALRHITRGGVWKGGPAPNPDSMEYPIKFSIRFGNLDPALISARFTTLLHNLLTETITSFDARFPAESFVLLRCFRALDPTTYAGRSCSDMSGFLNAEFDLLYSDIGCKIWDAAPDKSQYRLQVKHLREVLCRQAEIPRISVQLAWMHVINDHAYMVPDLITLFHVMMVIVSATAVVERGFSMHKIIKSKLRSRLKVVTMDSLLRVKFLGPKDVAEFDYEKASNVYHTTSADKMLMTSLFKVVNQIQVPDFDSLGEIDEDEDYAPTFSESDDGDIEEFEELDVDEDEDLEDDDGTLDEYNSGDEGQPW
jgi:hypothetical protein